MGKMSDKEKENIILKAVEAIQESINQIQVNYRGGKGWTPLPEGWVRFVIRLSLPNWQNTISCLILKEIETNLKY